MIGKRGNVFEKGNACTFDKAWCANCFENGHPAYMCPLPHKQEWPSPMTDETRRVALARPRGPMPRRPALLPPALPAEPPKVLALDELGRWHSKDEL